MLEWEHEEVKTEKITSKSESGKIKAEKTSNIKKMIVGRKNRSKTANIKKTKVGR